ncbi:MAG: hypothetical protein JJ900_15895 [Rhodospirillales bacterium]|nr:hypothetical protein [Rhodospirillales bacterium]MBO6788330.1 hypothetical protein [Rhodospirillales bacterium]
MPVGPFVRSQNQRVAIEDVAAPGIVHFHQYWDALRGDRFAPSWREIHLEEIDPKIVPYIVVTDVLHDPLRFLVRFWGTQHTARKGADKTGKLIGSKPDFRGSTATAEYAAVVETKKPVASRDMVNLNDFGRLAPFEQSLVRFPLSDDGIDVHNVISVATWDER